MKTRTIAVVGCAMMDLTCYLDKVPAGGETLLGELFTTGFGGKGANQAVMAAHNGAQTYFIGTLGEDLFGRSIAENFKNVGIHSDYIKHSPIATGVAHIWVEKTGENRIVIIPGANNETQIETISKAIAEIPNLFAVVIQSEVKEELNLAALKAAKARGCLTVINPAPYRELPAELLELTDWLIPNESEFRELHPQKLEPTTDEALRTFRPGKNSIVTLGASGAALITSDGTVTHIAAPRVNAIDTTGAGDCFVGTFVAALSAGKSAIEAIELSCKTSALSVTRKGAQASYPTQSEIATLS